MAHALDVDREGAHEVEDGAGALRKHHEHRKRRCERPEHLLQQAHHLVLIKRAELGEDVPRVPTAAPVRRHVVRVPRDGDKQRVRLNLHEGRRAVAAEPIEGARDGEHRREESGPPEEGFVAH